ncbi:insecticidal delta-endotoxin Cry8Ea1 family protein [Bacillus mycoides]|uniref:insecticidal delta-endotoxin Cry8Ea1 family protein n=1 Tax=Bacillus mycoides TaxID=1405 RepID=UPI003D1E576B
MVNLKEKLYPIPYNVMATPPLITDAVAQCDQITNNFFGILMCYGLATGEAWKGMEETGIEKTLLEAIGFGFSGLNGQKPGFLDLTKLLIGVGGKVVGMLDPVLGAIQPILVAGLSLLAKLLWPKNKPSDVWDLIKVRVQQMIIQDITEYDSEALDQFIQGFEGVLNDLDFSIQIAICQGLTPSNEPDTTNPPVDPSCPYSDPESNENVRMKFSNAESAFLSLIPQFQKAGHEIVELPRFCMAATLHLKLLQNVVLAGKKWGYSDIIIQSYSAQLRQLIKEYTAYVMNTISTEENKTYPNKLNNVTKKGDVDKYLGFLAINTIEGLDYATSWKFLDPFDYPYDTQSDLTRLVVNPTVGPHQSQGANDLSISYIDMYNPDSPGRGMSDILNLKYTQSKLKTMTLHHNLQHLSEGYIDGIQLTEDPGNWLHEYRVANSPSDQTPNGPGYYPDVNWGNGYRFQDDMRSDSGPLTKLNMRTQIVKGTRNVTRVFVNDYNLMEGIDSLNNEDCSYPDPNDPTKNINAYCQTNYQNLSLNRVHRVYPLVSTDTQDTRIGFVTTHINHLTQVENIIGQTVIDSNGVDTHELARLIRTIPVEKGDISAQNGQNPMPSGITRLSERITGSGVVQMAPSGKITIPIRNLTAQKCFIRFYLATTVAGELNFTVRDGNTFITNQRITVPDTSQFKDHPQEGIVGVNGVYILVPQTHSVNGTPQPLDPNTGIELPVSDVIQIEIVNSGNTNIILDRIEFVPFSKVASLTDPWKQSYPTKKTVKDTHTVIWSDNTNQIFGSSFSVSGAIYNLAKIQYNLWRDDKLLHTIDLEGPSPLLLQGSYCVSNDYTFNDTNHPVRYPETGQLNIDEQFNKVTLDELSDSYTKCFDSQGGCDTTCDPTDGNCLCKPSEYNVDITIDRMAAGSQPQLTALSSQVKNLFLPSTTLQLKHLVSDYQIDQLAIQIEMLSNKEFGKEKIYLRKLINAAKQLSVSRNLLYDGNFKTFHSWIVSGNVKASFPILDFKDSYLFLPSPIDDYSTLSYAYQKINEDRLKPNTRYQISGFIAGSTNLELVVSRYNQEVKQLLNIKQAYPHKKEQQFKYFIDVGSVDFLQNLGIEFGIRILNPTGRAKLGNLEIREERPLTAKEIQAVKQKEKQWKITRTKEEKHILKLINPIIQKINNFYENQDWNGNILANVTYQDLAWIKLPDLPGLTHWFMIDRQGEFYQVMEYIKNTLEQTVLKLEERNLIHNGNFNNGFTSWELQNNPILTQSPNGSHLILQYWNQSVSQVLNIIDFNPNQKYKLRVYAQGQGRITINNGNSLYEFNFSEKTFTQKEFELSFSCQHITIEIQAITELELDTIELVEI